MNFVERYYQKTRTPFAELLRYFFASLFRIEAAADDDSYKVWMIQILALLVTAAWYVPVNLFRRYVELHGARDPAAYRLAYASDQLNALLLMTIVIALLTVIEWSELFPSRQDHLVLTPLPIARAQFFGAKLAALTLFFTLAIGSISFITGVALPGIASGAMETRPTGFRMLVFTGEALGACYFMFWGLLAVQGTLMAVLPVRWFQRASFAFQMTLLVALLCALPLYPYFPASQLIETRSAWLEWLPAAWFWGWGERAMGAADWQTLSSRAGWGLGWAVATASLAYLVSYAQYSRHSMESAGRGRARLIDAGSIAGSWFGTTAGRATCEFTLWTLARCRKQKMVFLLIAGAGVALIVESSMYMSLHPIHNAARAARTMQATVIAAPLTLSFFAMVGLRRAFRLAEEPRANWLFQFLETTGDRDAQVRAVLVCFLLVGALPFWAICAPLQVLTFGAQSIEVLAAQGLLMFTLARYLLWDWRAIPFALEQNAGRRHFIHSAVVHIVELSVYSFMASGWIQTGLRTPIWFAVLGGLCLGTLLVLRNLRKSHANAPLEFAERVPEAVETLRLVAD